MARRTTTATPVADLTAEQALEVLRAKSARWAATYDPATGTVECRRSDYVRRPDGTIPGLSYSGAARVTRYERRPLLEVAREVLARDAAKAARAEEQARLAAQDVTRRAAIAADHRAQAAALEAEEAALEHVPDSVRAVLRTEVARLRAEADRLEAP